MTYGSQAEDRLMRIEHPYTVEEIRVDLYKHVQSIYVDRLVV